MDAHKTYTYLPNQNRPGITLADIVSLRELKTGISESLSTFQSRNYKVTLTYIIENVPRMKNLLSTAALITSVNLLVFKDVIYNMLITVGTVHIITMVITIILCIWSILFIYLWL